MKWLPIIGAVSAATAVFAFYLDRLAKPRRERRIADAKERQAVAQFMSERMQSAFKVLIGEDPDPDQGVEGRPGVGKRLAVVEQAVVDIRKMLNGGGIGSAITQVQEDLRETREDLGALAVGQGELGARIGRLEDRFDDEVREQHRINRDHQQTEIALRTALQAAIEASPHKRREG